VYLWEYFLAYWYRGKIKLNMFFFIIKFKNKFNNINNYLLTNLFREQTKIVYDIDLNKKIINISLLKIILRLIVTTNKFSISLPLSNSTVIHIILFILKFKKKFSLYTVSDGLGDCYYIDKLIFFKKIIGYKGHLGCNIISPNNFYSFDINLFIEDWVKKIKFEFNKPYLIYFKIPLLENTSYDLNSTIKIFKEKLKKNKKYYISSSNDVTNFFSEYDISHIGLLSSLTDNIKIGGLISFPSTVNISFKTIIPEDKIIFLDLPIESGYENKKFTKYKETLSNLNF
jgi:hypothetical protein